jgi:glycosyltransferase involved in cell wall biosynthesis
MQQYYHELLGLKRKKTSTWSSGFSGEIFNPDLYPKKKAGREFEIFYHGGISLSRGLGALIKAVKLLKDKNFPVHLKLIGNVVDKKAVDKIIHDCGAEEFCQIEPPVPHEEIPNIIINCDLPAIPLPDFIGWRVSSPLKLMEYLALEKPIVLTDIEAHRDVVGNADYAFFAKSPKPEHLAEAIEQAYGRRHEFISLGKKARQLALSSYTWDKQSERLLDFLQSL